MTFWFRAILSAVLFGASTPVGKLLLRDFSPPQLAGFLYLGAALGVSIPILYLRLGLFGGKINRANFFRLVGSILFGGILAPLFLLWGLRLASASSVSLWLNLELVATVFLGHVLFRDGMGRRGWTGTVLITVGALSLSWESGMASWHAGLFLAIACLCWGLDNHFTALIDGLHPMQSTFWKGLAAGSTNLAIGLWVSDFSAPIASMGIALLTGACAYGASIVLYISAAQALGAVRSQMVYATAPFFGLILSAALLGESLTGFHAVAALFQILGLVLVFGDKHAHHHSHPELEHTHLHSHDDGHHTHTHATLGQSFRHTHFHRHESLEHIHPHWPDLHHRHSHRKN
jgi:drug/metabolite transporter (DMT)-like permease